MGYRIKEVREQLGMTQEELSEKAGVSRTTIWALETQEAKNVSLRLLLSIAKALGTTIENIFFEDAV